MIDTELIDHFYSDRGVSISSSFLDTLTEASKARASWLKEHPEVKSLLGTPITIETESEPFEYNRELSTNLSYLGYSIPMDLLKEALMTNTFKGMKFTKYLKKLLKQVGKEELKVNKGYIEKINLLEDMITMYEEYLSSRKPRGTYTLYLTDNINEMLGATENCSYGSCFRVEGEYHQGAISMANTPSALMLMSSGNSDTPRAQGVTYKETRAWLMFDPEAKGFRLTEIYSSVLPRASRKLIADKLYKKLWGKTYDPEASSESKISVNHGANFYNDSASVRTLEPNTHLSLLIGSGININTGEYQSDFGTVTGLRCEQCGDSVDSEDDLTYVENMGSICSYCRDEYTTWCEYHEEYEADNLNNFIDVEGYGTICTEALDYIDVIHLKREDVYVLDNGESIVYYGL